MTPGGETENTGQGRERPLPTLSKSAVMCDQITADRQNESSFVNHNLVVLGPLATPGGETANTGQGREMLMPTCQNQSSVVNHITADSSKSVIFC